MLSTSLSKRCLRSLCALSQLFCSTSLGVAARLRRKHSAATATLASEEITVDCRSSGTIKLNIFHPYFGAGNSSIICYLPQGPILSTLNKQTHDDEVISALSSSSGAIVVKINYRLSESSQYPLPIYDVLAGYDWIMRNMLPKSQVISRLGICGELVGGSIATALALTECRLGNSRISAAAVNSPIVDWLFRSEEEDNLSQLEHKMLLDVPKNKKKRKSQPRSWDLYSKSPDLPASTLLRARRQFFRKPEDFFDRFASPVLFFRSPDAEVPVYTEEDSLNASLENIVLDDRGTADALKEPSVGNVDLEMQFPSYTDWNSFNATESTPFEPSAADFAALITNNQSSGASSNIATSATLRNPMYDLLPRRKYHRVHPPAASGLRLPEMLLTTGSQSVLYDQCLEFSSLARRSMARELTKSRHISDSYLDDSIEEREPVMGLEETLKKPKGVSDSIVAEANRRIALKVNDEGVGLWTGPTRSPNWRRDVQYVGEWFRRVLS